MNNKENILQKNTGKGKMTSLCKAMAEAFREIEGAVKDKDNPFFRSKYADLGNVVDAIKPALANHGLWFIQKIHPTPGIASVETIIMHESGESISCGITAVPIGKWDNKTGTLVGCDAQAMAAGITYARRLSLSSAFGVAPMDDDGNAACLKEKKKEPIPEPQEEVQKLGAAEVRKLANKVATILNDDQTLHCLVEVDEMYSWLAHCQEKRPLQPGIDGALESNRAEFLASYNRWLSSQKKAA